MLAEEGARKIGPGVRHPGGEHGDEHVEHAVVLAEVPQGDQSLQGTGDEHHHAVEHAHLFKGGLLVVDDHGGKNPQGEQAVDWELPVVLAKGHHGGGEQSRGAQEPLAQQPQGADELQHRRSRNKRHHNVQRQRERAVEHNDSCEKDN